MTQHIALVTGGNRGIGFEIAKQLAQKGHQVILACRDKNAGLKAQQQLQSWGLKADVIQLDVTEPAQIQQAYEYITSQYGRLDILVNNAGVALDKWVSTKELDINVLKQTMDNNVYSCLRLIQVFLPMMQHHKYGRIVNMSSELGSLNDMQMGMTLAYRMSKTALNVITKVLAAELESYPNIKINSAAPGWVKTELGGDDAPLSAEQGADTPVWLACLPNDGPTGGFFKERKPYPW